MAMGALEEILLAVYEHQEAYPAHGYNCACMDEHIRRLRQLSRTLPESSERIRYIFRVAAHEEV